MCYVFECGWQKKIFKKLDILLYKLQLTYSTENSYTIHGCKGLIIFQNIKIAHDSEPTHNLRKTSKNY